MNAIAEFKPAKTITFDTVQQEHKRLQHFMESSQENAIVLDMSVIEHCDSAGLALMLEAKRLAGSTHKTCEFRSIPDKVWNLARFCGIESIFS